MTPQCVTRMPRNRDQLDAHIETGCGRCIGSWSYLREFVSTTVILATDTCGGRLCASVCDPVSGSNLQCSKKLRFAMPGIYIYIYTHEKRTFRDLQVGSTFEEPKENRCFRPQTLEKPKENRCFRPQAQAWGPRAWALGPWAPGPGPKS